MNKCLGCGIVLQNEDITKDGYVSSDKKLCQRCFRLKHYNEYHKTNKNNQDYLKILDTIPKNALVVYLSSAIDLNMDYITKFKNVILCITKRDLLPKSIKDSKIRNYIKENYNIENIEIISSIKNYNLDSLYNNIKSKNKSLVYFVGNTNSGKSTLINKIIKNYTDKEIELTTSLYPETTLDKIEIPLKDFVIVDTPGIVNNGSLINLIDNNLLKKINVKKEIKPRVYQIKNRGSLIIENFLRIDYETKENSMIMYISNSLNITRIIKNDRLKNMPKKHFELNKNQDLVIADLGFIKFVNEVKIDIYTYEIVKIETRNNFI